MHIDYRIGDMFKGGHKFVAHGCNAQGVMGSGVAKVVKRDYPIAFAVYHNVYMAKGLNLGDVVTYEPEERQCMSDPVLPTIFNCITQNHYGTDQRYANYGAIQECIRKINKAMAKSFSFGDVGQQVAFPMIGAGLAGGHWPTIAQIIERGSSCFQPVVYDFTP